ncbi:hypothetical protein HDU96_006954 [Phlyctochytrium bullatum]|nr:hypothetical protein HDU96_006954 [Phlyctochytrium bullatum]
MPGPEFRFLSPEEKKEYVDLEVNLAINAVQVFQETLTFAYRNADVKTHELITEFLQQCLKMQERIQNLLPDVVEEDLLAKLIQANMDIVNAVNQYNGAVEDDAVELAVRESEMGALPPLVPIPPMPGSKKAESYSQGGFHESSSIPTFDRTSQYSYDSYGQPLNTENDPRYHPHGHAFNPEFGNALHHQHGGFAYTSTDTSDRLSSQPSFDTEPRFSDPRFSDPRFSDPRFSDPRFSQMQPVNSDIDPRISHQPPFRSPVNAEPMQRFPQMHPSGEEEIQLRNNRRGY